MQLTEVRAAIATAERRELEQRRSQENRPAPPDWTLELGLNRNNPPLRVHTGGCIMAGKRVRAIDRGAAVRALTEGITACSHCRPDSELGILD